MYPNPATWNSHIDNLTAVSTLNEDSMDSTPCFKHTGKKDLRASLIQLDFKNGNFLCKVSSDTISFLKLSDSSL